MTALAPSSHIKLQCLSNSRKRPSFFQFQGDFAPSFFWLQNCPRGILEFICFGWEFSDPIEAAGLEGRSWKGRGGQRGFGSSNCLSKVIRTLGFPVPSEKPQIYHMKVASDHPDNFPDIRAFPVDPTEFPVACLGGCVLSGKSSALGDPVQAVTPLSTPSTSPDV